MAEEVELEQNANNVEFGRSDDDYGDGTVGRLCGLECCMGLDTQIKKLKHSLEDWREILLAVKCVLLWDQQWYPGAIVGATTIVFTLLWLLNPSILSFVSVFGLTVTICDYVVPLISRSLFKSDIWTDAEEKEYEDICTSIVLYKSKIRLSIDTYLRLRTSKPKIFYFASVATLALLAWLGNAFNNLFLTYLFVTIMLLVPGMEHHGILRRYGVLMSQKLSDFAVDAKSKINYKKYE